MKKDLERITPTGNPDKPIDRGDDFIEKGDFDDDEEEEKHHDEEDETSVNDPEIKL